jgi:3-oxoacyl-[acyl-carrier protein] reductase
MRYEGRAAIVTGGAAGIGLAIARRLASDGARVAIWDHRGAKAAASALGEGHVGETADITDETAIAAAAESTFAAFGRVDLLVNNAGVLGPVARLWEIEPSDFRRVVEIDLTGAYLVCRAVVPRLLQQAGPVRGRIVNISSIQAKEGLALAGPYAAAKAGLIALTKVLGKELAREAVLVNCITPSAAETDMMGEISAERRADILGRIPLGRFVAVEEIAAMVAWLGCDECSYSTGAVFDLSGGRATY